MANTQLTQTGQQVQADLDKVEGMAEIKTVGSGLTLSSAGELSASGGGGGGTQLYKHKVSYDDNYYLIISTDSWNYATSEDINRSDYHVLFMCKLTSSVDDYDDVNRDCIFGMLVGADQ